MASQTQPSPYFLRRSAPAQGKLIELTDALDVTPNIDQSHPLREYWITIKRHGWLIVSCTAALFLGGILFWLTRVPLYTAEATILIERKPPQFLKMQDARGGQFDSGDYNSEFLKTQYEILKSRALAERVIREEGLLGHALFGGGRRTAGEPASPSFVADLRASLLSWFNWSPPDKPKAPAAVADVGVTQVVGTYLSLLEIRPVAGTSMVNVKFTTPDRQLSARLANAHGYSYARYGADLRTQTNDEAQVFLQQKLTELKERIEQSEAALNRYRKDKGIISVDEKDNVIVDRWLDLNKNLTGAEGERIALEAQMAAIRGRNYDELPVVRGSAGITALKGEVTKLESDYAALAKDFRAGYPPLDFAKTRLDEARNRLRSEIQNEVRAIETAYAAAKNKESQLRAVMDDQKKTTLDLKDAAVQYTILAREADTNRQLYDGVLQRLKEIGVASEVRSSHIYVMGKAVVPGFPSYPSRNGILLRAVLLGLALGVGLAFLLDQLDNTLKSPEEATSFTGLSSLGVVPDFNMLHDKRIGYVTKLINSARHELQVPSGSREDRTSVLDNHPLSLTTEAYRALRSALLLSQAGGPPQITMMTSAMVGDGKTTTLVNTAIVFAQLGIRVLIIDGDLRRPRCHIHLKMDNSAGLTELLTRQVDMLEAIRPTAAENLSLLSAGAIPPNPAELLSSTKMAELLHELRGQFEFIFIDSSPVMAVSDAVFLSTMVDGTVLVVNRRTPKPLVRKTLTKLRTPHTKLLGVLLNRVDVRTGEYGYYKHYAQYYHGEAVAEPS